MWKIVYAEFRYLWVKVIMVPMLIIPLTLLYFQMSNRAPVSGLLLPLTVGTLIPVVIIRSIEKRDRQNMVLPIAAKQLAWARIALILTPCVGYYAIYFILQTLFGNMSPRWYHDPYDEMMFFGLTIGGFCLFLILRDLVSMLTQKIKSFELDIMILVAMLAVILLGIPIALATTHGYIGNTLRLLCFGAGVIFLVPTVHIFTRRKTYLE